ncbi:AAA family ATPase [Halanaerobaculum tunisiense]
MQLIKAIEIKNFQSHADTRIELDDGFNVITGPSDQGKSAIVRALRWVLYNEPLGDNYIQTGKRNCRVKVELDTGYEIIRRRTPSKNGYIIVDPAGNQQVLEKIGRSVPQEVTNLHQMPKVDLDVDYELTLNLDYQLAGPFLLGQQSKGSQRAKALGRLLDIHLVDSASRGTNRDIRHCQQEEKRLSIDVEELTKELKEFQDLPALAKEIEEKENLLEEIKTTKTKLDELTDFNQKWQSIKQEEKRLENLLAGLNDLEQLKELLVDCQQESDRLTDLQKIKTELATCQQRIEAGEEFLAEFTNLNQVTELVADLESTVTKFVNLKEVQVDYQQTVSAINYHTELLQKLAGIFQAKEQVESASTLVGKLDKLQQLSAELISCQQQIEQERDLIALFPTTKQQEKLLADLTANLEQLAKLKDLAAKWHQVRQQLVDKEDQLEKISKEREELILAYSNLLKEQGECPTCFSQVDERLINQIINNYKEES